MTRDLAELQRWFNELPLASANFVRCIDLGDGWVLLEMAPPEELRNPNGAINGLYLAALADLAGGLAIATIQNVGNYQATVDLTIHYLVAAGTGPLRAEGRIIRKGRRLCVPQVNIYDGAQSLCAVATGTWLVEDQ